MHAETICVAAKKPGLEWSLTIALVIALGAYSGAYLLLSEVCEVYRPPGYQGPGDRHVRLFNSAEAYNWFRPIAWLESNLRPDFSVTYTLNAGSRSFAPEEARYCIGEDGGPALPETYEFR